MGTQILGLILDILQMAALIMILSRSRACPAQRDGEQAETPVLPPAKLTDKAKSWMKEREEE